MMQYKIHSRLQKYTKAAAKAILATSLLTASLTGTAQQLNELDTIPAGAHSMVRPIDTLPFIVPYYKPLFVGKTPQDKLVQSLGVLKGAHLESTPANSPLTALGGRIAGLQMIQYSGEPGNDVPLAVLRGRIPIMIVDGIPRTITSFNPEQIESITVLKDAAATAMLGMRGMDGAIVITTKKGVSDKGAFNLNFKAQTGIQTPLNMRKYLNSYDYSRLYNEALANDGKPAAYTQADLDAYKNHTNPFTHPDVDWAKTLLKDNSNISRYTINAEGATKGVNYFVSLDYLNQGGLFRELDSNSYNTNSSFKRYIFRSNLDIKISERAKVFMNLFGRIKTGNQPGMGASFFFSDFVQSFTGISRTGDLLGNLTVTPNNAYPVLNPNGTLGGNVNFQDNLWGRVTQSGYASDVTNDGFVDAGFFRNMDDLLKGWWVKATLSYNTTLSHITNRDKQFQVWQMTLNPGGDTTYTRFGPDPLPQQNNSSYVNSRSQQFYTEVATGISKTINKSAIDFVLLGNSDQYTMGATLPEVYKGLATNIKYTWDEKYMMELSGAYQGNNRYATGQQYGFFPAVGAAWNVHKESFLAGSKAINALKLRASYGLTGSAANNGYYDFVYNYRFNTGYVFGTGAGSVSGMSESSFANFRTWEKILKLNIGVDVAFLQNRGWFSTDIFQHNAFDLMQFAGNGYNADLLGMNYPLENLGKNKTSGFETTLGWSDKAGKLHYNISANVGSYKVVTTYNNEPSFPHPWMARTGALNTQYYGYTADGFVTTAGGGPVVEGYQSVPGDIKYVDRNGDGVINQYDMSLIGTTKPRMFYGLNTSLNFNGFYLNLLIDGVANAQSMLTGNSIWEFQNNGKGQAGPHHLNRWTAATAATADYPRLSVGRNVNNHVTSTFWLRDMSFIRLRNTEIGYNFTGGVISRLKLQSVRVFANGLNLITISTYNDTYPEAPFSNYPVQRTVNAGISVQL